MKKNSPYYLIEPGDSEVTERIALKTDELKCLYNLLVDFLDDYPDMLTYKHILGTLKKKLDQDTDYSHFYGVNEITHMDLFWAETRQEEEVVVGMNIQSTDNKLNEDVIYFFNHDQMETICKVHKKMKKSKNK